jgi:hypothetical protein
MPQKAYGFKCIILQGGQFCGAIGRVHKWVHVAFFQGTCRHVNRYKCLILLVSAPGLWFQIEPTGKTATT